MEALSQADAKLGANIRRVRMARGMTMKALAAALEEPISGQQVQKYEHGYNRVPATTLVQLAKIMDVNIATLIDGINLNHDYGVRLPLNSLADQNLIRAYAQIENKAVKDALRTFVAALSSELHHKLTAAKPGGNRDRAKSL